MPTVNSYRSAPITSTLTACTVLYVLLSRPNKRHDDIGYTQAYAVGQTMDGSLA